MSTPRPFTPAREAPAALAARTVGRTDLLANLHAKLLSTVTSDARPHVLLAGPRGAGKSHVVEVALFHASAEQAFRDRAVVVRIPEDSTAITRFSDLLREVLKALDPGAAVPPPEERAGRISELLDDRVVILVIENLDRVFHDIRLEGQRNLRAWVESSRQVMLLATTPSLFTSVTDRSAPWYGGLATLMLPGLTAEEGQELVALLAAARGDQALADFVRSPTGAGRIKAVAQLTGGSPRVWMVLASVATKESLDELVPAVEELLEGLVPYYQQLLWSLSPSERRLVVALAQTGRMTAKQVAEAAEIDPNSATTTLRRLAEQRWVESERPRSGDKRLTYYRIREPLLRYHLQYREESEQPLSLVVWLLKAWFSPRERALAYYDGPSGSVGEGYLMAAMDGPSADTNSLVTLVASEYRFVALDWCRSADAAVQEAGRLLATAVKSVPSQRPDKAALSQAVATHAGDVSDPDVLALLKLALACLRDDSLAGLVELSATAAESTNPYVVQLVGENLAAAHGEVREFSAAQEVLTKTAAGIEDLVGREHETHLRIRGEAAYWTGEAGDPNQALHLFTELLPDMVRVLGADHAHTKSTMSRIAELATSLNDLAPVVAQAEDSRNELVVGALVLAAWRIGAAGPVPESPPTEGRLGQLLHRVARAAAGDEQARSDLPPEMLAALESL